MKKEITIKNVSIIDKLKNAETQIKKGEIIDAEIVFAEMRKKYRY